MAARYVNAASQTNVFQLVGDTPDDSHRVFTLGLSSVVRGAHQTADGTIAGGLQGFINYKVVEGLRDYTLDSIELGLRYEF
ncbi:MAG TPA: hypothetical protein VN030_14170 [Cellvibrio sp.]|nr:hypothetical protein [Cellvibrio sp.]